MTRKIMDNSPGNPTPCSPTAKVVGRIDLDKPRPKGKAMMDSKQREIIRKLFHDRTPAPLASMLSLLREKSSDGKVNGITRLEAWDAMVAYTEEAEADK